MLNDELTLQDAAEALGVHYMTAYRYVRLGLLPAVKQGGVWRVRRSDVDQFRSGATTTPVIPGQPAPWAQRLESRLLAGDARGAWGVVEAALSSGTELCEVYLDVLSPAMVSIGERWANGDIDVAAEHRATVIAMRMVGRLGPRFVRRGRTRGGVVVGAPAGESHALPAAILADLLRLDGWDVSDLGADTPADAFARTVASTDGVIAAGISVTNPERISAAAEVCAEIRRQAPGVVIVVGGRAMVDLADPTLVGADAVAGSAEEFLVLLVRHSGSARPLAGS